MGIEDERKKLSQCSSSGTTKEAARSTNKPPKTPAIFIGKLRIEDATRSRAKNFIQTRPNRPRLKLLIVLVQARRNQRSSNPPVGYPRVFVLPQDTPHGQEACHQGPRRPKRLSIDKIKQKNRDVASSANSTVLFSRRRQR